jgi:hypothetical protein
LPQVIANKCGNFLHVRKGVLGMHAKLGETVPLSEPEKKSHQDIVVRLWKKTLEHRNRALHEQSVTTHVIASSKYLQYVFKVSGCQLLHFGSVVGEATDCTSTKGRDKPKPSQD